MVESSKLEALGYYFDDKDVLRTISDNVKFNFTTQEQYEELGEAVEIEVYKLMKERCGLVQIPIKPSGCTIPDEEVGFIFATPDYFQKETILILIHGSGVVRAGQWARRLIINEDLESGTQLEYINKAIENNWGVLVFNSNHNSFKDYRNGGYSPLKYSENPVEHCIHAWQFLVHPCPAKKINIVAHSRGGYDVSKMLEKFNDLRVTLVCLTDSPVFEYPPGNEDRENPLIAINFIARGEIGSSEYYIKPFKVNDVIQFYAGTKQHESSSHTAFWAIFHILEKHMTPKTYIQVSAECRQMVAPDIRARKKRQDLALKKIEKEKALAAVAAAQAKAAQQQSAGQNDNDGPPDAKRQRV